MSDEETFLKPTHFFLDIWFARDSLHLVLKLAETLS